MKTAKRTLSFAEKIAKSQAKYGTYNPEFDGFGSSYEWKEIFEKIMGLDEAFEILGSDNPLTVLGFSKLPTLAELKKVYKLLMFKHHPDKGGKKEDAQRIIAAYTTVKEQIH